MKEKSREPNNFMSAQAEEMAIKDTLSMLKILIPIIAFLQLILAVTWVFNLTGDRSARGSLIYFGGYIYMFCASILVWCLLKKYSVNIAANTKNIFHAEMTYAWMLPIWAAILTLLDAVNDSPTFSILFYVITNILTIGICYMNPMKWTIIQGVTGTAVFIASIIMPLPDHFTFLSELAAFIVISIVSGRLIFQMKINNYERQAKLADVLDQANYDSLTGVYTREAFYRKTAEILEKNPQTSYTLIASDIDNFKQINAIYGTDMGNEVLCFLAHECSNFGMITGRYGADQFIALLPSAEKLTKEGLEAAITSIADRAPVANLVVTYGYFDIESRKLPVNAMCDRALLAAKSIQHNYTKRIACYDGPVSQKLLRAKKFSSDFHEAIENHEFVMWYQPKIDPYTEKIVAAEALVRWKKETGYVMPPAEFLGVYEENGLIIGLDEYVFRTVCLQQKKWMESGKEVLPVSINLSRKSMERLDLVQTYKEIVEEAGIPLSSVPIEITESAAVQSVAIRPIVQELYDNGFTIHMDDFGSGQSSINGLNVLHIDIVKIDKSLVDNIGEANGNTILKGLMKIIKDLGLRMVAEGVETESQLRFLMDNHIDEIQGYYYSKPLPVEKFETFREKY